jgi:hypothetical protein
MPGWLSIAVDILVKFQWPLVTLILGGLVVRQLRRPISSLFERAQSFSKGDLRVDLSQTAAQLETTNPQIEDLKNWGTSPAVLNRKEAIKSDFKNRGLSVSGEATEVLISQLAVTQLLWKAEEIYFFIFGSQIVLLKSLNQTPAGIPSQDIATFFEGVQNRFDILKRWNLQGYVRYLIAERLITFDGTAYRITIEGKEFLAWLARTGRSENKNF